MLDKKSIKSAFESMLYIWGEPLEAKDAADAVDIEKKYAVEVFEELSDEYEKAGRGLRIRRINDSFQIVTPAENADIIRRLCTPVKIKRLSQAALEVLAIIAYRQPVTKGEIDAIRGIKCDRVIDGLMAKGLVMEKGRKDAVGRPILYGTTDTFLKNFGFSNLDELPEIEDLEGVMDIDEDQENRTGSMNDLQIKFDMTGRGQDGEDAETASTEEPDAESASTDAPEAEAASTDSDGEEDQ